MGDILQGCRRCKGRLGVYANGVDCGFSKIPTKEPEFEIGETVYIARFPGLPFIIRKREWDGRFIWRYYFSRERTPHDEDEIFRTPKESHEALIREKLLIARSEIALYCKRYGGSIESVTRKLLPSMEEKEQ